MNGQTTNQTEKRLCVGLLAHVDAGKTTLSEAMLYAAGAIRTFGRVDHQDTFLDTDQQERSRGITIFSKQAVLQLPGCTITLLDTPGHVDFSAEMERTLQVLDCAILVISGTDGVQGHTKTLWQLLRRYQIPTLLFINKMDIETADRAQLMDALARELSETCIDFSRRQSLPSGWHCVMRRFWSDIWLRARSLMRRLPSLSGGGRYSPAFLAPRCAGRAWMRCCRRCRGLSLRHRTAAASARMCLKLRAIPRASG